jgi:hypothetical protein
MSELQQPRNKLFEEMKDRYERVFSSVDGQRVLDDIALSGGLRRSAFNSDALIMAFNEGKRDLAQHILEMSQRVEVKVPSQTEGVK